MNRLASSFLLLATVAIGCDPTGRGDYTPAPPSDMAHLAALDLDNRNADAAAPNPGDCTEVAGCYTVYAHGDHVLYKIDLANKMLVTVGNFNAPMVTLANGKMAEDVITDLAVAPDNTIYGISHEYLYTVDAKDGHVSTIGAVTQCGSDNVALTTTPDGTLYAADFKGAFCKIDLNTRPPTVKVVGMLGGNLAVSGDLVAVKDGTIYATAYNLNNAGTQTNNLLVKIDPATGRATQTIGSTSFPKLYGAAFDQGLVFGFTHDGSGTVVTIDPKTGKGTLFNKFTDPMTGAGISFAGAGVNSMVQAPPPG